MNKRIIIDLLDDGDGELVIRINAKGNVQIITPELAADDPTGSAVLSDPDIDAVLARERVEERLLLCARLRTCGARAIGGSRPRSGACGAPG